MYELFWDHIFIMFWFYFIYYPLFMNSKHTVNILIRYDISDSCLNFLIDICVDVVIDIIYLFINVIQVRDCCILYNFFI